MLNHHQRGHLCQQTGAGAKTLSKTLFREIEPKLEDFFEFLPSEIEDYSSRRKRRIVGVRVMWDSSLYAVNTIS